MPYVARDAKPSVVRRPDRAERSRRLANRREIRREAAARRARREMLRHQRTIVRPQLIVDVLAQPALQGVTSVHVADLNDPMTQ
jgi:hypothetical protein